MKMIRSFMTLAGLFTAFLALGVTGARGQVFDSAHFAGTFTLPFEAQWGKATLPAGEYTLRYGLLSTGADLIEVAGKAEGSPHSIILAGPHDKVSAAKNRLVCVREGDVLIVRTLELPAIGVSVNFALPRGVQLMADKRNTSTYAQLAGGPMLIQRIEVQMNGE